nr:hypothetical protein [Pedobacter sp. ELA7]
MATQEDFNFESFKKEAIAGLYARQKETGTDGVLAPMMKHFLESMMTGELEHHCLLRVANSYRLIKSLWMQQDSQIMFILSLTYCAIRQTIFSSSNSSAQ